MERTSENMDTMESAVARLALLAGLDALERDGPRVTHD